MRQILVGFILVLVSLPGFAQNARDAVSTVRVTLNAAYDDAPDKISQLETVARVLPRTEVDVPEGDTISAFVARQYGFGRSDGLTKTYELFERLILEFNRISDPKDWKPGKRLAPTLPKWAK